MKLGGFGKVDDYLKIGRAGYDFAELDIPEIEELSEKEFAIFWDTVKTCGLKVLIGARLLPIAEPLLFRAGFSPVELIPYLKKICKRTSMLGIKKVILGNGKARSLLTEEDKKKESNFIEALRIMAEIAGEYGQELILEPLGPKYSNYINTIPEAVSILMKADMQNIFTMADLRHMVWAEDSFENLIDYVSYIHHIHIDYPRSYPERRYPTVGDDYDYDGFLSVLQRSGYHDTLTIEADIPIDWNLAHEQAMGVLQGLNNV